MWNAALWITSDAGSTEVKQHWPRLVNKKPAYILRECWNGYYCVTVRTPPSITRRWSSTLVPGRRKSIVVERPKGFAKYLLILWYISPRRNIIQIWAWARFTQNGLTLENLQFVRKLGPFRVPGTYFCILSIFLFGSPAFSCRWKIPWRIEN